MLQRLVLRVRFLQKPQTRHTMVLPPSSIPYLPRSYPPMLPYPHCSHARTLERHLLLNLRNGQSRVETLRTSPRTIQNSMAAIQTHAIIQCRLPLLLFLISRVSQPPIALQQHRRPKVFLAVPPVGRAGGRAAGTENALVQPVQLLALLFRLQVFFSVRCWRRVLQVRLDRLVLLVELREVRHDVLYDVGVGEWVDFRFLLCVCWNAAYPSLSAPVHSIPFQRLPRARG